MSALQATVRSRSGFIFSNSDAPCLSAGVSHREHMKRIIPPMGRLLIGIGVGWYCGYTRPTAFDDGG